MTRNAGLLLALAIVTALVAISEVQWCAAETALVPVASPLAGWWCEPQTAPIVQECKKP